METVAETWQFRRPSRSGGGSGSRLLLYAALFALLALAVLAVVSPNRAAAADTNFYVATTGSDTTGNGTIGNPWATIQKARDYIRTNGLNVGMTGNIIVNVKAGTYYVSSTIAFTDADSGSNGFSVIYRNQDAAGSAHFVGGEAITGWTLYSGSIYRANVGTSWKFYTLYENGVRARTARYPNYTPDSAYPTAQAPYLRAEGVNGSNTVLQYKSGDLNPSGWDLDDAQLFVWSGGSWSWFTDTIPITSINTTTRQITLDHASRYSLYQNGAGSRYYIQGVLNLLDQPGEFYLDTSAGYLYYWARDGAIASQTIVAPKVQRLVSLIGSSDTNRAHHIQFDGLAFEDTDFTDWFRHAQVNAGDSGESHTYPEYDRQINMPAHRTGMIYMENTDHITIQNAHLKNAGYSSIYMLFYNQNNTIAGNWIEHSGLAGVLLEGRYPGEGDVLKNNTITNNLIHDVGELAGHGAGVYVMNAGSNEVSYSEIYNSPRYAVAYDAYPDIPSSAIYVKNNVFKNLNIHDVEHDSGDTGAIYAFGISDDTPYLTNTIDQVTIDNVYAHPSMSDYAPNGIFMDNDSNGQLFSNIKVTNTQNGAFRTNDSGSHSLTNVSWQAGFNDTLMDYNNIGLKSTFVYPVAPSGLTAADGGSQVNLSWKKVNNAASYTVKRGTASGGPYATTVCSGVTATSCADTSAATGTTYYYIVTSTTSGGAASAASAQASVAFGAYFEDGFESGLTNWTTRKGTASTSTTQARRGANSYVQNEDMDVVSHPFGSNLNRVVSLWYYDNAADTTIDTMARVDSSGWDGSGWRGIGVISSTSTTKYAIRVDGTFTATSVNRSTGWHEFRWDYTSGTKVDLYVDGVLVASPTGVTSFSEIAMGDWWGDGKTRTAYYDDVEVLRLFDSFESGLGKWTTRKGTASTSTTQAHAGTTSYVQNEDMDVISAALGTALNKIVTLWFYDNAADTTVDAMARADNTGWDDGTSWRGMGVSTGTSTTKYVTRIGSTYAATTVTRTTGWHQLKWDYTSGTKVDMYVDGTLVASPTGVTNVSGIAMGDWWGDARTNSVYYDDVRVGN
ncbi:MAG: right-handed parallel beta-helix repeat-containing protein [Paenibacillaceae bacterium]|nr:right-handed parallel beta-helix repeat-containing protein [Paenibacillaceae bacterium]